MQYGNPFVVYQAIKEDGVTLPADLDRLCRWLVHWDSSLQYDFRDAWTEDSPPTVDENHKAFFAGLFDPQYRNSSCLAAAWELIAEAPWATDIRARFLREFSELVRKKNATAEKFQNSFKPCPPNGVETDKAFRLAETPLTNSQFELFDPSHLFWRNQSSQEDDQPAVYVSWHMANLCCLWFGQSSEGWMYRLPKEAEWEFACRAGTPADWDFWFLKNHKDFDGEKHAEFCWCDGAGAKATRNVYLGEANRWDLQDMHGNVCEWCEDLWAEGAAERVVWGGSWRDPARRCHLDYRFRFWPGRRYDRLGFRVAIVPG
jgi:formylglycine-generating enzyme required for sulfatase activity